MWSIRPVPGARTLALWIVLTSIAAAEPPFLHTVVLKGIPADSEARAREVIELAPGGPFDPEVAQAASGRLMEWWRKRYYPLAKVRWTARPTPGQEGLDLIFVSEPGPRGRLKELLLPKRRSKRRFPRHVKIKMSNYPRNRGKRAAK